MVSISPENVRRFGPVARDSARDAQFLERDEPAVVPEDHRKRRGPALDGFHLQNQRRAGPPAPGGRGQDIHDVRESRRHVNRTRATS